MSVFGGVARWDSVRRGPPVTVAPDVIVEVVSPGARNSRRDRIEKVDDSAPLSCCVLLLLLLLLARVADSGAASRSRWGSELVSPLGLSAHAASAVAGTLAVPGFEGLVVDVDALFADLD